MKQVKSFENMPVIIITVYDRKEHLTNCLESLEKANAVENFHIIIGSDAPSKNEHANKVNEVKSYLKHKQNDNKFFKFSVIDFTVNVGQIKNFNECHKLAKSYGHKAFIAMEDDIIVGKFFLEYICEGLLKTKNIPNIISVNSYLEHNWTEREFKSAFLFNGFNAYGYGCWYNKWDLLQKKRYSYNYAKEKIKKSFFNDFLYNENAKSYPFLAEKFYEAADIEFCLIYEMENLWALYPNISLSVNKGMDGSGLRSGINLKLQNRKVNNLPYKPIDILNIEKKELCDLRGKISLKYQIQNLISYSIYSFIPFGFKVLVYLRSMKQKLK